MRTSVKSLQLVVAVSAGAMPFAFGVIRAIQTGGRDVRYVWVALAAACGAIAGAWLTRPTHRRPGTTARAVTIFIVATVAAMTMATLLGTRIGPGGLIVSSSFAFCFAVAFFMRASA